jgi:glycosyltransferase involved in cell wall biosynthesis
LDGDRGISRAITVIVPTFNRLPMLRLCLQHLERQTVTAFEVIVVNDGSTDDTAAALLQIQHRSPLSIRVLHQKNGGPARGRNLAVAHAETPLCLFIGDDILASPTLVQEHVQFHLGQPDRKAAGLGRTQWDRTHQEVTPYMLWYEDLQFDYRRLDAGVAPTWRHVYTSNLSMKTGLLQSHPFDERFTAAAWEDGELGYRLTTQDELRLTYLPNALATHVHPTTFLQAAKRMRAVGRAEHLFHEIWPAARKSESTGARARIISLLAAHPSVLATATAVLDRLSRRLKPGKLHALLLHSHHQLGYNEAGAARPAGTRSGPRR